MNERAVANPTADQFAQGILPKVRGVLVEAVKRGWPDAGVLTGQNREGDNVSGWKVDGLPQGGDNYSLQVLLVDKTPGSFKRSVVNVQAHTAMELRWRNLLNTNAPLREVKDVDFERSRSIIFAYDSGRIIREDHDPLDPLFKQYPAINAEVCLEKIEIAGMGIGWELSKFRQSAILTNPGIGRPVIVGRVDGVMDEHGRLVLEMGLLVRDESRGKLVQSSFNNLYEPEPISDSSFIYKKRPESARINYDMPSPFNITVGEDEKRVFTRGRANAARIARLMPNQLTQEQVATIFQNVTEGKVFTAGVCQNPAEGKAFTAGVFSPREIRSAIVRGNQRSR